MYFFGCRFLLRSNYKLLLAWAFLFIRQSVICWFLCRYFMKSVKRWSIFSEFYHLSAELKFLLIINSAHLLMMHLPWLVNIETINRIAIWSLIWTIRALFSSILLNKHICMKLLPQCLKHLAGVKKQLLLNWYPDKTICSVIHSSKLLTLTLFRSINYESFAVQSNFSNQIYFPT